MLTGPGIEFRGQSIATPPWLGDFLGREQLVVYPAKLVASQFSNKAGVKIVASAAIATATSITVTALTLPTVAARSAIASGILIPSGTTIRFGTGKFATLTANASLGDTTLTVEALPTALDGTEVAYYNDFQSRIYIPSGTVLGRTFAERDAGTGFGPAAVTDDEIGLLAFEVVDANRNNTCELVRPGGHVAIKENYLPDYTTLSTAVDEVQTLSISGSPTGGTFVLGFNGYNTTRIAYNASNSTIDTALEALTSVGSGGLAVTGSGSPFTITFSGTGFTGLPQNLVTVDGSLLTGGTPVTSVVRATAGGTTLLTILRRLYQCFKSSTN